MDFYGNSTKAKTVLQTGSASGLTLEIFVGIPIDLEILTNNVGLAVFVHENWTSPLSVNPTFIYPNAETSVVISKTKTQKEPQPYSDCQDLERVTSNLKEAIQSKGYAYEQNDCILQCYQNNVIKKCGCYGLEFINYFDSANPCTNGSQTNCSYYVYEEFLSEVFIELNCTPLCPLECNNTKYRKSISTDFYPTAHYANQLLQNELIMALYSQKNFSYGLGNQIIKLNIYLESLSYTEITEAPAIDVITLFSTIGGSIGLMLGVCCATLVESIELGIKVLLVYLKHKKEEKNDNKNKIVPENENENANV